MVLAMEPLKEFFLGIECVMRGVREFYRDSTLWKYALLPLFILLLLYGGVGVLAYKLGTALTAYVVSLLPQWEWLISTVRVTMVVSYILVFLLLAAVITNSLFEAFGSLFFDTMVADFERRKYGFVAEKMPWQGQLRVALAAILFASGTLILSLFSTILALFVPLAGWLITIFILSHRIGFSYQWSPIVTHNALAERRRLLHSRPWLLRGFGTIAQFILVVPFLGTLFIPGLVLGGSIIHNEYLPFGFIKGAPRR